MKIAFIISWILLLSKFAFAQSLELKLDYQAENFMEQVSKKRNFDETQDKLITTLGPGLVHLKFDGTFVYPNLFFTNTKGSPLAYISLMSEQEEASFNQFYDLAEQEGLIEMRNTLRIPFSQATVACLKGGRTLVESCVITFL